MQTESITVDAGAVRAAVIPAGPRIYIYTPAARLTVGARVTWRGDDYRVESVGRGRAAAMREREHALV